MRSVNSLSVLLAATLVAWFISSPASARAQKPAPEASLLACGSTTCRDTNPNDCLVAKCIEGRCERDYPTPATSRCTVPGNPCSLGRCVPNSGVCAPQEPLADGTSCPDNDGNPCTGARCLGGSCSQTGFVAPDNASCPDTDGSVCTVARCQAGSCNQGGTFPEVPSMVDPTKVEVKAREIRVTESEAYTDCCWYCSPQWLEALTPTPFGPVRQEPDGGLPNRATFCGDVVRYGVNDEQADPRDIMFNMVPSPGYEHFVKGFLNTECTGLSDAERQLFVKPDSSCPVSSCLAASENPDRTGRCLHVEITPAEQFFGKDPSFLPIEGDGDCASGWGCKSALEPASQWSGSPPLGGRQGQDGRQVCVSGVYAVDHGGDHRPSAHRELCCSPDAGHDRPEIHPMDAIWFRHPDGSLGWVFGVFQDDSNRYSFPHCSDYHNDNRWSEAPRDMTFRFPFRLPRSPIPWKACLRRTRPDRSLGVEIPPINVTTASMPGPIAEVKSLQDAAGATVLELIEQPGAEGETQARLEGCVTNDQIAGFLTVRVAVGCPRGSFCPSLNDTGDAGSGFYYGEVVFQGSCSD